MSITLPFTRSHAFIIGINDYAHITPLKTAVNDAKGIAQRLEAQHGYEVHGPLLNPTKTELEQLFFTTMPNEVGEEDRVVFYFAGHGIALDGEEGPNGYIVPADAKQGNKETLIPMDALHQTLNELPCRHGLLILDCCFSGAFKWSTGYRDLVFDLPKVIYEERFWRYVKDPAWQVITSSAYDQKAVDVISNQSIGMREEGQGNHSPFAKALFEALEGAGDVIPADQGDGVITTSELYAYLRDSVENQTAENSKSQSPSMFNLSRHDKGEFIFLNPRHRFNLPPTPDRNPFMGLASYNEADSNFFFGRDRVTEALLEKVQQHSLVVVSGASGTGKSSVIKAGLLPQLRKAGWELLAVIRPGKEPKQVLEEEIGDISSKFLDDKTYLLIIDQYEELITQTLDEADRTAFEQEIANWLNSYPQLRIILSVRADFEPQFESHELAPWWQDGRYVVPAFSLEEIREIISKPALQAVLFYEPIELTDRLEEDVAQAPGALPLLSFSLSELYYAYLNSGREDRALTLEDYQALGGVIGALRTKADEAYTSQDDAHQSAMRKLMLRMVSLEGGELAGKRVFADELIFSDQAETQRLEQVATDLVDSRLISRGKDLQGRIYLEPAHDALVRAWGRLWEWIKAVGEEKLVWQNKLSQAVVDYHDLHESGSPKAQNLLWNNNPRLDVLRAELQGKDHSLNAKEEAFVQASVKRRTVRRRQLIASLSGAVVIFAVLALLAWNQRNIAQDQTRQAEARSLAFQSNAYLQTDPTMALRLGEAAYQKDSTSTVVLQALSKAYYQPVEEKQLFYQQKVRHKDIINAVAFASDNVHFLTASDDRWVKIWNLEGEAIDSFAHPKILSDAQFSPDGRYVASIAMDSCYIWEIGKGLLCKWQAQQRKGTSINFSPDGSLILTSSADGTAILWTFEPDTLNLSQAPRQRTILTGHQETVISTAFAPDSKTILTGSADHQVRLWDLDGNLLQQFTHHNKNVFSVDYSSDGKRLLSGSADGQVVLFQKTGEVIRTFSHDHSINFAAFSSDGDRLLVGSEAGNVWVYDTTGLLVAQLTAHQSGVRSGMFSPDGSWILTASADQTARIWKMDVHQMMYRELSAPGMQALVDGAMSPDGKRIALASEFMNFAVLSLDQTDVHHLADFPGINRQVGFSSTSEFIMTASGNTLQIWDQEGQVLHSMEAHEDDLYAAKAAPNHDRILSAYDKDLKLWNFQGELLHTITHLEALHDATFSPQSGRILSVTESNHAYLWDPNGRLMWKLDLPDDEIWSANLSTDEKEMLSISFRNKAFLWSMDGGDTVQLSHSKAITSAGFSPDPASTFVLTSSADGTAVLWTKAGLPIYSFDPRRYMSRQGTYCTVTSAQFSADGKYILATTDQGVALLWDTPEGIMDKLRELPLYPLVDKTLFQ